MPLRRRAGTSRWVRERNHPPRVIAVLNIVAAIALSVWLFSGEEHVPDAGTAGSWIADGLVVLLIAAGVTAFRRSPR
jgi:hypothetical protein